jgi:hypothetical protein
MESSNLATGIDGGKIGDFFFKKLPYGSFTCPFSEADFALS